MFGFLKDKIKASIEKISSIVKSKPKKKPEKPKEKEIEKKIEKKEEKKPSLIEKITTKTLSKDEFERLFEPLEMTLLESNIAYAVINKIKEELQEEFQKGRIKRGKEVESIKNALKKVFSEVLIEPNIKEFESKLEKKPLKVLFIGVNGSGKTTTLAKLCNFLKNKGKSCVISASDTFRAASIEQLEKHAAKLNVKVIKHDYKSDAAAVAFDAIKHAESKGVDIVLIDTAGRSHANVNLMDELKKVNRVVKPDITIFVGDSLTGNDVVDQAKTFLEAIDFDYVILTKADVDQKGGAIVSVGYVTKKPILFLGTGQGYADLELFKKDKILEKLGL